MANEVLREKSNCVVCQSGTSRFLKQKHNNRRKLNDNIIARLLFFKTNKKQK